MTIRPFEPSDLPAYIPLRLQALRDHPSSFGSSYEDQCNDSLETWRARTQPFLDGTQARLFVTDAGHGLVALLGLNREPGSKRNHAATLISVYVHPSHRGQHLVDQMFPHALAWSRAQGVTLLRLNVTTTNSPAISCYTRLGFTTTGTLSQYIRTPDGTYHDEYLMSRPV